MKTSIQRLALSLTVGAALVAGLAGCVPLVVGGAAVGAGFIAADRRSSGAQLDDQTIEVRGASRISAIANDNMNIAVTSFNRQVLLTGTVGADADRLRAEEEIKRIDNVRSVVNAVTVGPGSTIQDRANDTYITSKVKASLANANFSASNSIKVVTERGVVYLMGIVTQAELDQATNVTRGVSGVTKVVRMAEIVTAQQLNGPQGSGASAGGTGSTTSSGSLALPPMAPLPPADGSAAPAPAAGGGGVVTSPVR